MLPSIDLGRIAISEDFPTGSNPKNLPEYETMFNEISKIGSLQGGSTIDWEKIENTAVTILKEHAKDISVSTYLTIALSQNYSWTGWHIGTTILIDILNTWWEHSFPPIERMRARANSITWWHDRSMMFFSTCKDHIAAELSKDISDLIAKMDDTIKTLLPDANPLYNLQEALRRVPLIKALSDKEIDHASENATLENQEPRNTIQERNTIQVEANTTQTVANHFSSTILSSMEMIAPEDTTSGQKLLFTVSQQYLSCCFNSNNLPKIINTPLTWKIFYITIWGKIQNIPPSDDFQTLLPAPDSDRINALFKMLDAEKYEELIRACVFFAPESPFCLDIQYLLGEALAKSGLHYAATLALAKKEISEFITTFRGIHSLCFTDGQPFVSDIAKDFFANLISQVQNLQHGNNENAQDILTVIRTDCAENIASQDFFGAMKKIHNKAQTLHGSDLLKLKLEEIRLLMQKKHIEAALAISTEVETSLDFYHLEEWDSNLSQDVLKVLRDVWSAQKKSEESTLKLKQILARLYCLNPTLAF